MRKNFFTGGNALPTALGLFVVTAVASLAQEQGARMVDAAFLDILRAEVRTNHPTVAAAQARVQAAEAGVRAVRLWEDPMAGVGMMAAEREMRADDGDLMFMAEQVLPRPRLYQARKARATAERSIFEAETRSAALILETLVAQAALELALVDETLAIGTNELAWLESMAANAREKLKDPMANASEPLRIESEVAQERQRIDSNTRHRLRLMRQLNILLGRSADEAWPVLRLPQATSLTPALAEELNRLFQVNPMLHALFNTAEAARAEIEVARRERRPIFSVGAESSVYSGGDFRQATVVGKMTLPLFNRSIYRANVERAQQEQLAAEKEIEALQRKLRGEAVAAHTEAENAARQADTFSKEVIPRTEKAAESTQNAWISSKASILEVLEARRALLNSRLEERRFVAAHRAALEMLRSIVPPQTKP
ncbi:MAG: TolC family protein [Verrucomicrobiales bacterium]|nr:TolC family protein [Verrucomicrobiales bacterium]